MKVKRFLVLFIRQGDKYARVLSGFTMFDAVALLPMGAQVKAITLLGVA